KSARRRGQCGATAPIAVPASSSAGLDQSLGDERLDVLAPRRIESVAAVDEVWAVALRPVPGLGHVVERAVGLVEPERTDGDPGVALQGMDPVDVPVDRQEELARSFIDRASRSSGQGDNWHDGPL